MRDFQRKKLYDWEDKYIIPIDKSFVAFENAQSFVDYVWDDLGYLHPPKVYKFRKNVITQEANASRLKINMHENIKTCILLHEMAHSLTGSQDEINDRHGPNFVGIYIKLLDRYFPNLSLMHLTSLLNKHNIKFDLFYTPKIERKENE